MTFQLVVRSATTSLALALVGTGGLALAGCPASHDVNVDAGPRLDAPGVGVDASSVDAPGIRTDAPAVDARGTDAPPSLACDVPSACTLRPASCCGSCGAATPDDMIALPVDEVAAYVAVVCEGIPCPECARPNDPYLVATCAAGACVAVDLHAHSFTECTASSDCTLSPAQCCACGLLGMQETIAHNPARGGLGTLICDPEGDCPPCVPDFGALGAQCDGGRCIVFSPAP